jgi:hypothetical protein
MSAQPRAPGAPRINPQNVPALKARKSPRNPAGPFADLTWEQRKAAEAWLYKFCARWGSDLPNWRRAILIGTAKRLALHPPKYHFGHFLHTRLCSNAYVRKYRDAGLPYPHIVAMQKANAWKRAGRPPLPSRQLPV